MKAGRIVRLERENGGLHPGIFCTWQRDADPASYVNGSISFGCGLPVRRFCCRHCPVTVSCLPQFAQPYRLVCNQTIEAFFDGEKDRAEVERWQELLGRYRRRYEGSLAELCAACGALFGRSPPQEESLCF